MKKVIAEFESKMNQTIQINKIEHTLRDVIFKQVDAYKNVLLGKSEKYKPYQYK